MSYSSVVKSRSALSQILFTVGVELDHMFGSKWKLIELSQWSGHSVDHNVSSLDDKGVLHGIGVVISSTPVSANEARKLPSLPPIPRQQLKKSSDVV